MKKYILITWLISTLTLVSSWADHHESEADHNTEKEHAHGTEEKEEPTSVGPKKGIVEASETKGIKLSPEALKNFELETKKVVDIGPWTFPISARFQSGDEVNIYRLRDGFFKRIDFTQNSRNSLHFVASSKDLRVGDEVVIVGIGYLRIAEVTAFGGNSEGHSH